MYGHELLLACEAGNVHRTRALAAGAPIDVTGKMGDTPLHCALRHGREEVAQVLLEAMLPERAQQGGACPLVEEKNSHGDTPLHMAAERCYVKVVRRLLESGASTNATNHVRARRPAAMS